MIKVHHTKRFLLVLDVCSQCRFSVKWFLTRSHQPGHKTRTFAFIYWGVEVASSLELCIDLIKTPEKPRLSHLFGFWSTDVFLKITHTNLMVRLDYWPFPYHQFIQLMKLIDPSALTWKANGNLILCSQIIWEYENRQNQKFTQDLRWNRRGG